MRKYICSDEFIFFNCAFDTLESVICSDAFHEQLTEQSMFEQDLSEMCGKIGLVTRRRCWWDNRTSADRNPRGLIYTIYFDEGIGDLVLDSLKEVSHGLEIELKATMTDEEKRALKDGLDKMLELLNKNKENNDERSEQVDGRESHSEG